MVELIVLTAVLLFLVVFPCRGDITCVNDKGVSVDWFINYKLPKLESYGDTLIGAGSAYAYIASNSRACGNWKLSDNSITSPNSMVGKTLSPYYERNKNKELTYLFYNDDPPNSEKSSLGHTKGVVLFDDDTGIWLIHSVPKFAAVDNYEYPSSGHENGQIFLCMSFSVKSLNEIGKQLLFNAPGIYTSHLSRSIEDILDEDVKSLFTENPKYIRSPPFSRITTLNSRRRMTLTSFAKDNQFRKDLYSALVAPELDSDLFVQTWRRGSGTPLDPSCNLKHEVEDVETLGMELSNKTRKFRIEFSTTEDHSKWAISQDSKSKWVCVSDINRMASQEKRGGGSLCFKSICAWNLFNSTVVKTDTCMS